MAKSLSPAVLGALLAASLTAAPRWACAHGFAGLRFFPPTLTIDDPFATDEFAFPSMSYMTNSASNGEPGSRQLDVGFEFSKLIVPHLSLGISDTHSWIRPAGGPNTHGWQNLSLEAKYELYINKPHEFILSIGLEAELGGTGSKSIDSESFANYAANLFFGKGFGDLPSSLKFLRPLAMTGVVSQTFPSRAEPNTLEWGLSLQYQLPYLQQHVMDVGLPRPFRDMILLVEVAGSTPENRDGGVTTATINPGVLWESKYGQLGIEAVIPINRASGEHVGVIFQVSWFLDDLAPRFFGQPLFFGDES